MFSTSEYRHIKKCERLNTERLALSTEDERDNHFIKHIEYTFWNYDAVIRAKRLVAEGKLKYVSGYNYGKYVKA